MEHSDEAKGNSNRKGFCPDHFPAIGEEVEDRFDKFGQRGFAYPPQANRSHGNTELGCSQIQIQLPRSTVNGRSERMLLCHELPHSTASHRHEGKLSGNEEPIGQHQDDYGQQSADRGQTAWIIHSRFVVSP
jgi:hypothetical protein